MSIEYIPVAELNELQEKSMKVVNVAGRDVIVTLLDGQPCAFDRLCPHEGGYLEEGVISGGSVYCDDHSWAFDVKTGVCTRPGGAHTLRVLPIEEHDGRWCVRIDG